MKILSHGLPFFCAYDTWGLYRGKHEVRSLSAQPLADFRLRPEVDTLETVLERIAPEFVPDLIIVWTPENDPPPLGIERSPVPTVCLAGDWNLFHAAEEFNLGRYDVVLSDRPGTKLLSNDFAKPVYWGPLYAQNSKLYRRMEVARDIDVLYLGNLNLSHRAERGKWLQRLANLPKERSILMTTDVWGDEYARLLSRAKIVFNHSVRGELNLRVFETMVCGGLAFFEEYNAEVKDYFTDGVDIVLYNEENFEEKIEYYLDHPEEAEAIAARGAARAQEFAGETRFDALIDFVLAQPVSGRPFLKLDERERALQDFLMVTVSQRPEYGPVERRLGRELMERFPEEPRAWSAYARSILYFRDRPPSSGKVFECIEACKKAISMQPSSAILAMNAASAAHAIGHDQAENIFLQIALKTDSIEPSAYLWGGWQEPFWTGWLRARAEKRISLETVHAEAHARASALLKKQGDLVGALVRMEDALAIDPENPKYIAAHADLLWDLSKAHESVQEMIAAHHLFPLDVDFRITLATRCAQLGFGARADKYVAEVHSICERLRVPYPKELTVKGHAESREVATVPVMVEQERRLRAHASEKGDYAGLLWFLATLGRLEEVRVLGAEVAAGSREGQVVYALLTEGEMTAERGLDLLGSRPFTKGGAGLFHALLKRCLAAGDLEGAWAVVEAGLEVTPTDVSGLNLLARVLSQRGDARLQEAVEKSLSIAPRQEDIEALTQTPFVGEIYLGTAPKLVPVSFYLPAYNVENYIRDTMEHVFLQDYPVTEFFVVDDGSRDGSMEIARQFPVTILHHDENRGLAAARNTALAEAMGEWLLSVDTDARPEMDFVRQVMLEAETRDAGVAAIGGVLIEEFQEVVPDKWRARMMAQHHGPARQCPPWFLFGSTMCIERAAALAAGGYDEGHRTNGEDTELCKALGKLGKRLCYSPLPKAHHLRRDDLHSVLRTWWNWHYWVKVEANAWRIVGGLVDAMIHNFNQVGVSLQRFVDTGEHDLWYITFLFGFYDAFADLNHAAKTGLLERGEARVAQEMLIARLREFDGRMGGAVTDAILRDTLPLREALGNTVAAELTEGFMHEFARYFEVVDALLSAFPAEVYQGIEAGAEKAW